MLKYRKIVNEKTRECEIGIGTNEDFYKSIGMELGEVEQSYDGRWFEEGYAPAKPEPSVEELSAQKRSERDAMLRATDVYMLSDFPISDEERELYKQYRQYLRDLPTAEGFPEVEVMRFEEWSQWIGA